jgi:hypothetical protein
MANNTKRGSYYQGPNNQFYYIEVVLYNQIEGQKPMYVPFILVESLTIHESLFGWATRGEIVFNNDFEVFLRGSPVSSGGTGVKPPYIDRTDGRNRLHIKIYPADVQIDNNGNISETTNTETKFPKLYWEMDFDFVIIEVKDLPVGNNQRKKRMYKFIDERYQILQEKNLEWSSESIAAKKLGLPPEVNVPSAAAALNPNEVLKELLTIASTNGDTSTKINIGFDDSGSISSPNIPLDRINNEKWDVGDSSNLVSFYPEADRKMGAIDDINYVLSHCVSFDGFPVILDYGRSSKDKNWHLNSLSDYYKNATPEQVERLVVEDGLIPNQEELNANTSPYIPRASNELGSQTKNFSSVAASRITSYKYSPMVTVDDNRIKNSPYCYYNEYTGFFNLKKEKNHVLNLINKLTELGYKGLYSFTGGGQGGQILLNINQAKSEGQMTKNLYALNGPYSNHQSPLNQMILDAIFLNQAISFQCLGITLRTPGKFIFIDRLGSGERNAFDDRFLGQWFVSNVSHLFTQENYVTEVVANKIDSFAPIYPTGILT